MSETEGPQAAPAGGLTWLLLMHQIPPKPSYSRVKVWRRLQRLGAVAVKNSVYALPAGEQAQEDFQWLSKEVTAEGGDAFLLEARFLNGIHDDQLVALFHEARNADYEQIASDAQALIEKVEGRAAPESEGRVRLEAEGARLKRRLAEVERIDFFAAPKRDQAREAVSECLMRLQPATPGHERRKEAVMAEHGKVWVTRVGVKVDRIASAWLIRRFLDPEARFEFVPAHGYEPKPGEVRFDMFEAEYTHEGDECTFEVLLRKLGPDDAALKTIAEIVHDIDVKDGKFGRPETPGFELMLAAIALHPGDEVRIERGSAVLDDLYALFKESAD